MRRLFRFVLLAVLAATALLVADAARFFFSPLANAEDTIVAVEPGMSFRAIAGRLEENNIIVYRRDTLYLSIYARFRGVAQRIKSGEYEVPARQQPAELLELLVSGQTRQYPVTIIDGRRFSQIREAIADNDAFVHTLRGSTPAQVMAAIGQPREKAEGRFLPDTYMFPRGTQDVAIFKRAYAAMEQFLAQAWDERDDDIPVDTPYEALILASIIEKETAVPAERQRIAGVFSRRLEQGMRLQTDPTVIYGIEDYDGDIRSEDLRRDTPYNTYTRAGLPPTPIAMPSRASIVAALHPAEGDALYFVARDDGTHVFSATLAEHNRAVREYQLD